ncbi:MAG: UDP-N-acetylmuramoyl-tripeptide--D-alanyl-D-alanine ligase [Lachnospiraceae bacterium]|nr:UDP-N-acetylmuramoyl-tripeptide--D-alanyl-D-alanine ligase [Lachnospiraceae bacterium]
MKGMSLDHIRKASRGTFYGEDAALDREAEGVVIDSRQVQAGFLYVAMRGERVDGHRFIPDVFDRGAAAVLSEKILENPAGPYILVESCPQALKDIAEYYRSTLAIPVVGIAGSVGKTSTKEMIAAVLEQKYRVLKTEGNFNNEIGLPLTLLRIRQEHEAAVVEMGISDFGEMHRLAKMARPDVCVMTNIGQCHLENLIDRDGVLRAKSEIFDYLKPDGVVVLNGNDDKLSAIGEVKGVIPTRYFVYEGSAELVSDGNCDGRVELVSDGNSGDNTIFAGDKKGRSANNAEKGYRDDAAEKTSDHTYFVTADFIENHGVRGMDAVLHFHGAYAEDCRIHEPIPGLHNIYNACAAACVGDALGLTHAEICTGIAGAKTIAGRTNLIEADGIVIIDDCYNANPVSMKASLDVLSQTEGRKIAVLGDMGELGKDERALHREVGEYAAGKGIDFVFCTGELSEELAKAASAGCTAQHCKNRETLLAALRSCIKKGDTVLVKASHFMQYSEIVRALQTLAVKDGGES